MILWLREATKYLAYRAPLISRSMRPNYKYKIDPGQLSTLAHLIDRTREVGGAIVEIGVAQGFTSAYLLEHLRTTGDPRKLLLFDTFAGFTKDSIDHELHERGKANTGVYGLFRYGSEEVLRKNLQIAGYTAFQTYRGMPPNSTGVGSRRSRSSCSTSTFTSRPDASSRRFGLTSLNRAA